ncbi:MAG: division/cell wall cluster transcriptional repressor MraZ [Firmicutes bacterium]|nr:division/cell wall cluster transcriptional repressor MraZ [Bacillota bacterium]
MANFVDEYERQLDDHNRIILPSKVRDIISETVYVTQAPSEKCLHLYEEKEWERVSAKINQLPTATDKNAAAFVRLFFGKATAVTIDKQGRIPIAKRLVDYAGLGKNVVLVGANTRLEIWDSESWTAYQSGLSDDIMIDGILKYGLNI